MSETPKKTPKPRPTLRTPAVEDQILQAIANGTPLAQVCREPGMPHPSTWYTWCDADDELDRRFVRARDHGAHAIATEALELADGVAVHGESIQKAKLQIDTRLKLLAKWSPKLYGDKTTTALTGADGGAIKTEVAGASIEALRELTEALMMQAGEPPKGT
jgi:hypothetical protein